MAKTAAVLAVVAICAPLVLAAGDALQIEMKDIAFVPTDLKARKGDRVVWRNDDMVDHTATSDAGGFDLVVRSGQTATTVLTRPGTFTYTCRYHPNMTGRLRVEP